MSPEDINEKLSAIQTKEDLANFIEYMRDDLKRNEHEWENVELLDFLESMAAWIRVMDRTSRYENSPSEPSWELFGNIIYAAKIYE